MKYDRQSLSGVTTFDKHTDKIDIIEPYHSSEELQCSCGDKQVHKEGFHVRFRSGEEGLVGGSVCGPKYFGVDWDNAWEVVEEGRRRIRNRERLVPTRNRATEMQRLLRELEPYGKHKDTVFGAMKQQMRIFYDRLEAARDKDNGRLVLGSGQRGQSYLHGGHGAANEYLLYFSIRGHRSIALNCRGRMASVYKSIGGVLESLESDEVDDDAFEAAEKKLEDIAMEKFFPLLEEGKAFEAFFDKSHLSQFFEACEKAGLMGNAKYKDGKLNIPARGIEHPAQTLVIDYEAPFVKVQRR